MKSRNIKPDFWQNLTLSQLSPTSLIVYLAIQNYADDAGILPFDGGKVRFAIPYLAYHYNIGAVQEALEQIRDCKLGHVYTHDETEYLILTGFLKHQSIRRPYYRHPSPDGAVPETGKYPDDYVIDYLVTKDGVQCPAPDGPVPPIKRKGKEKEKEKENSNARSRAIAQLPLKGNRAFDITEDLVTHLKDLFPTVNIHQEIKRAIFWCQSNPTKRKVQGQRFLHNWMDRASKRFEYAPQLDEVPTLVKPKRFNRGTPLIPDPEPTEQPPSPEDWEGAIHD